MRDPLEFRTAQRAAWSSVAGAWRDWWSVFDRGAGELVRRMLAAARIGPGQRVLDVATGIGEPALSAARAVGPEGRVVATDLSPAMLAHARARAAEARLANVELLERDAEELGLESAGFDAALSRFGLMLLQRPERAVRGIRAALRPGGRLAAAVWCEAPAVPFLATAGRVAREVLGVPPPPPDEPGPFRLGAAGSLEALLDDAGFEDATTEVVGVRFEFDSPERYAAFTGELSGSLRRLLSERTEAEVRAVREAIAGAAESFTGPGGRVAFENRAWLVSATRPAER